MKKWHLAGAALTVAAIPALSAGCEPAPLGELVLIVKTDMAPPKDFNKLRIQVFNEGALKFDYEGPLPGDPADDKRIVLPSTLGLVAPEDAANAIKISVGVRSGDDTGPVRVVRQIVTTIPSDRVAMLNVPIQFLCKNDDIPFDDDGNLKSECDEGKTCIAGSCEDNVVDSSTLPDYDEKSVYGGNADPAKGKCFDVATCFDKGVLVDAKTIDKATCSFPLPKGIASTKLNLALGVESDGICNSIGCLVVLDAGSETGWRLDDAGANVVLPQGVCANLDSEVSPHPILQIVQASTSGDCPQKDVSYPTCGAWSAVESAAAAKAAPQSIAGAQDHPIAVTLHSTANGDFAYWTNGGSNTVKGTSLSGGKIISITSADPPRDIFSTDKALFWTAANGLGSVNMFLDDPAQGQEPLVQLASGLAQPDGLTVHTGAEGTRVFWTEFADPGRIFNAKMNADFTAFDEAVGVEELSAGNAYPARLVADNSYLYWTNEGSFDQTNGSVARLQHAVQGPTKLTFQVDGNVPLAAPRAIAVDTTGNGTTVYFATIADGKVWRITNADAASPDPARIFAEGLSAPNGIAIDGTRVYIANRGDGTIVFKDKSATAADPVTSIAAGQKNPGTMLVRNNVLLWVNEGPSASDAKEGSIVKFDLSKL